VNRRTEGTPPEKAIVTLKRHRVAAVDNHRGVEGFFQAADGADVVDVPVRSRQDLDF